MTGVKPLGMAEVGPRQVVGISVADARSHLWMPGPTGVGKSTLLGHLALSDIAAGRGTVVIDPKGDLVDAIVERVPEHRVGDIAVIDPRDAGALPALNVLDTGHCPPEVAADHVVASFAALFAGSWGPRTEDILRSVVLTAMGAEGATLVDAAALLDDGRLRRTLTAGVTDTAGLGSFWAWFDALSPASRGQVTAPLRNKLRAIFLRPFARALLGSGRSSIQVGQVLDGGVLLVRLPKGLLGEDTARLVGSLIVAQVFQAALGRAQVPEHARRDAAIYVDEAQNFLALPGSLEDVLAEARGYRVSFTLAHQHLAQLPAALLAALSANARSKVVFAPSPEDAKVLSRHTEPVLSAADLAGLGARRVAVRLLVGGRLAPAFTLSTLAPAPAIPGRAEAVRAASRARFGVSDDERRRSSFALRVGRFPGSSPGTSHLPGLVGGSAQLGADDPPADAGPDWWPR